MGIFDSIRERLGVGGDDYYDDDEYYDDEFDGEPEAPRGTGLLGNTPRPEASSISVYSHSTGRPVGGNGGTQPSTVRPVRDAEPYDRGYGSTAAGKGYAGASAGYSSATAGYGDSYAPEPRVMTAQLPPYVIKPTNYEDVQSVIRRVRTGQPVVLAFQNTKFDIARRILDFCFGLACGLDGTVEELGDRVFVVLPANMSLSEAELDKLVADGVLTRR